MSNVYKTYRATQFQGDTRIDLLLRLYRATIESVREARSSITADPQSPDVLRNCLHAVELVQGIKLALDPNYGEVPKHVSRLCDFVVQQLLQPNSENLASCDRILTNLMEGYEGVREAAVEVERKQSLNTSDTDTLIDSLC